MGLTGAALSSNGSPGPFDASGADAPLRKKMRHGDALREPARTSLGEPGVGPMLPLRDERVEAFTLDPAEIAALFAGSTPQCAFALLEARLGALLELEQMRLRGFVLDGLEAGLESAIHFSGDWLEAVFAASPAYLRAGQGAAAGQCGGSFENRLCGLVIKALAPAPPAERARRIGGILPALADISLACALLRPDAGDQCADELFGPATAELRSSLRILVEKRAANGELWRQAAPAAILFWWASAQEDRVYAFVSASMHDESGLSALLAMLVERAEPGGADVIAVRRWSKIINFQSLEKAALQLALSGASHEDRRRARRFLEAFGNGKSELFQ